MNPLRISVVSYLNAEPFHAGLLAQKEAGFVITGDIPSLCADKLLNGEADLGLVPVAMYPLLKEYGGTIVTDFCIAADGKVASVILFSEVPVAQIQTIYLDHESRTSVTLMRLLAARYFKIQPKWLQETTASAVHGTTARVIIGDRALEARGKYNYETDLAESWKEFTGLPFVFACWVAMRPLQEKEVRILQEAFKSGLQMRSAIALKYANRFSGINLEEYLFTNIHYRLNAETQKGLRKFLEYLAEPENQSLLPFSKS
jgi:chorismate dehydratase